jgi:hypothetical protein
MQTMPLINIPALEVLTDYHINWRQSNQYNDSINDTMAYAWQSYIQY